MANLLRDARRHYREMNNATVVGITHTQMISRYHIAPAPTAVETDEKRPNTAGNISIQMTNSSLPPTVLGGTPTSMDAGPTTTPDSAPLLSNPPGPTGIPTGKPIEGQGNVLKIGAMMLVSFLAVSAVAGGFYYFVIRNGKDDTANSNSGGVDVNQNQNTNSNVEVPRDYKEDLARAKNLFQKKDYEQASTVLQDIIKNHPNDASVHFLLGATRQKLLRNQEALVSYQQAVEIDPKMDKAWQQIGFILRDRMDYQNAEAAFLRASEIDPSSGATLQGLSETYMIMQDYGKALSTYEKLLRIEPNNESAHYNLGTIYLGKKDYPKAKRSFLNTIEINPNFAEAHNNLGLVYLHEGEVDLSILENERAVALKSNLSSAHYLLFLAYEQKRDFPTIRRAFTQVS